ncbi:MAG TPA: glycosyltransferase [Patescibacteria group bacterium]|nr:glycosyltransferase [Patescibacteria group bacterium]
MITEPRTAIVYDRVNKFGGAERVLLALREAFPQSVLFTSVFDAEAAGWVGDWEVRTSFLQNLPFAEKHHEWFAVLMPLAFESLNFDGFDIVISVTSEAAKSIITKPEQLHICYCLTPTRYLWSHTSEYEGEHFRWLKQLFFSKLREIDFIAGARPDVFIPISNLVKKRIEKYYHRECEDVIYPPYTQVTCYKPQVSSKDYYLIVSRLVSYKRIDLAIEACLSLQKKLVIVGTGSDGTRLKKLANNSPLISFVGFVPDEKLGEYYAGARALLCPQKEDFGIVSLEAQSFGTPIITYENSGVAETIKLGETGLTFGEQTAESLVQALQKSEDFTWDPKQMKEWVSRFALDQFLVRIRGLVHDMMSKRKGYYA